MMYTMCSFDKAWRPKELSPWCAVFSRDDLEVTNHINLKNNGTMNLSFNAIQVLEYREDLEYFYEDGYGFSVNYEQACVPLNDVFKIFR